LFSASSGNTYMNMTEEEPPTVVRFNVGGQNFQVSRSLIKDRAPSSMLAHLLSCNDKTTSSKQPIFLDRNSVHFAHLLDYLRYGSVHLPATVSKANFLRDLDYYGIAVPGNETSITQDDILAVCEASISKVVRRELSRPSKKGPTDFVAAACAKNFQKSRELETRFHDPNGVEGELGWGMVEKIFDVNFDKELLNESLAKHGLQFVKSCRTWGSVYIHVKHAEIEPSLQGNSLLPMRFESSSHFSGKGN